MLIVFLTKLEGVGGERGGRRVKTRRAGRRLFSPDQDNWITGTSNHIRDTNFGLSGLFLAERNNR